MATIVLWIDANIDNEENKEYIKELKLIGSIRLKLFKNIETAIEQLKYIEFKETKIIITGSLYTEFVKSFKENILDMYVSPKIIIFTKNKENFIKLNKDYINNKFYFYGGIATSFGDIKEFLKSNEINAIKQQGDVQLTFEYIDKKEKLALPLFFKSLIDNISNKNLENYTNYLYETYSIEKDELKELLGSIVSMKNIPIEILSRYYSRLYTANSSFHKNINKDLGLNKKDKYLSFIKILYEGVKFKSLPLSNNNILYRGSKISNEEINKIKNYLNKKIEGLPSSIVFSKSFLSFSKEKNIAEQFLKGENKDKNISKALFILEKDDNIGYDLSTHGDIEKISFYPNEREVLFFPFSSFEIKNIREINLNNEIIYEIKLLYLGKYLKDIENDSNLINNNVLIPNTEFRKQIEEFGLIKTEEYQTIKIIYRNFKKYANEINNIKNDNDDNNKDNKDDNDNNVDDGNHIVGEINIGSNDVNKDILIINSYENYKRIKDLENSKDDYKYENEKEIKKNTEIKINEKIIKFSYTYKFEKEGKYQIKYLFKNYLTKTNHMFCQCNSLTNLNLSNFITQNVKNMRSMFDGCSSLKNLNLTNFNTQNVTNMREMFDGCSSLINLNLSNFNTQNVSNMKSMFNNCNLLTSLNLSNFNTYNVTNMSYMFCDCNALTSLNLSNFNTKTVTNMRSMFDGCNSLTSLNLSNFNTQNVTNMSFMFDGCRVLASLNLSNFNTQNVVNMNYMFDVCNLLKKHKVISKDSKILDSIN